MRILLLLSFLSVWLIVREILCTELNCPPNLSLEERPIRASGLTPALVINYTTRSEHNTSNLQPIRRAFYTRRDTGSELEEGRMCEDCQSSRRGSAFELEAEGVTVF